MAYTTTNLLSVIERKSFAPSGQITFSQEEILEIANEEIQNVILPSICNLREEYFVYDVDYTVTANQAAYAIPARAIGMIAREISLIDSSGRIIDLVRMEPEDIRTTVPGRPKAFYLKNNSVVLYPTPNATEFTLRIQILLAPGEFILPSSAATSTSVNSTTITVNSIPSGWESGQSFDIISKDGAHEYRGIDLVASLISGNDMTFASLPSTFSAGDYIVPAGYSSLVQLPPNYRPILAQFAAAQILSSMNQPGASEASKKADKMLKAAEALISPRVQGEARTILQNNWSI